MHINVSHMKYTMQLQVMKTLQDTDNIQSHS